MEEKRSNALEVAAQEDKESSTQEENPGGIVLCFSSSFHGL